MVAEEGRAGKQTRVNCSAAQKEYLFAMWDKEAPAEAVCRLTAHVQKAAL